MTTDSPTPPVVITAGIMTGILTALAHSPMNQGYWGLIAFVPVLFCIRSNTSKRTLIMAGLIASFGSAYVMFQSIINEFPIAALAAAIAHSIQVIFPLMVWRTLQRGGGLFHSALGFASIWVLIELLRSQPTLNGFITSFYSFAFTLPDETAPIFAIVGGAPLLSMAIVAVNALSTALLRTRPRLFPFLFITLLSGLELIQQEPHAPKSDESKRVEVALVQTNWSAALQWQSAQPLGMSKELIVEAVSMMGEASDTVELIIFPEVMLRGSAHISHFHELNRDSSITILAGAAALHKGRQYNSIVGFYRNTFETIYHKHQLVPLYETPNFERGQHLATVTLENGMTVGIVICMDGTSEWMLRQTKLAGADFVAIISSTAYGVGYWTPQLQFDVSRRQAAAAQLPMVFLASHGPSSITDVHGRLQASLPEGTQGLLERSVEIPSLSVYPFIGYYGVLCPVVGVFPFIFRVLSDRRRRRSD